MNEIGSSETIRKTTLCFTKYKQYIVSHKKSINKSFLEWFIGFTENDAFFIVSKSRLFFIINQKQEKVLYYIKIHLGFGKVSTYTSYSRYIVADKKGIDRLIMLFNGNLLLQKTNAVFSTWLDARNYYSLDKIQYIDNNILYTQLSKPVNKGYSLCITNRESVSDIFYKNAWLSGFIDGQGRFNALTIKDKRYTPCFRVGLRFILDQKDEYNVLKKISLFLQSGTLAVLQSLLKNKENTTDTMYRYTSTTIKSHQKLIEYLNRYPLRTKKKVTFLRWTSLLFYIENRKNLAWQGKVLMRVKNLIKNINTDTP